MAQTTAGTTGASVAASTGDFNFNGNINLSNTLKAAALNVSGSASLPVSDVAGWDASSFPSPSIYSLPLVYLQSGQSQLFSDSSGLTFNPTTNLLSTGNVNLNNNVTVGGSLVVTGLATFNGSVSLGTLAETNAIANAIANKVTCSYASGAVFVVSGQTNNFTVQITNLVPSANRTYSITLVINSNTSSSKFFGNSITISSTSNPSTQTISTLVFNGGPSPSVSSGNVIMQQFNIVYTSSTTASNPAFLLSSVSAFY